MGEDAYAELEDAEVIAEAARGDVRALAALYDRYAGLALATARRMVGESGAEDLVQDVFMEVWRAAASYDPSRGAVRTWILVRLRSRALDRLRSAPVRREIPTEDVAPDRAAPPGEDPSLAPDRRVVREALRQLPEDQRQVLELAYFMGMSATEIAERMGSPVGTVKSRTKAAMTKLRAALAAATGGAS
jgi:RNA polymerase sigma-70 factor (ECF subfamily)